MATPERIQEFMRKSVEFVKYHAAEIQQILNSQRVNEQEIIKRTNSFCPLDQIKDRTVRAEDVERALKDGYQDGNILKSLMCMNNLLVMFPPDSGIGSNFKVRQYLENLKQIGGESAYGYAMSADVKGNPPGSNLFVVKSPRKIDARLRANQIHEYFVGVFGTNQLRSKIPNFSYILGLFQCSPPYLDSLAYLGNDTLTKQNLKDRRALTYCQNDISENQVNYLLYENVSNAVTLKDYIINGCTYEQFLNILTQIILAEDYAYRVCDFTHYDLHHENVLVRELPEELFIPYEVNESGAVQYLRTKHVATFIDYGNSHIKYQGNHYGYAAIEGGVYPNRSYPMYDIYKILMFSLAAAAFGNNTDMRNYIGLTDDQIAEQGRLANPDVFQNIKELVSYFNPEILRDNITQHLITTSDYLIKTRPFYYSLPYSAQLDVRPVRFFQDAVMVLFPSVLRKTLQDSVTNTNAIYGCANKGTCFDLQQAIMEYSRPEASYIENVYVFYEMVIKARQNRTLQNIMQEGENLYPNYMNQLRTDRNKLGDEYNSLIQGYTVVSLAMGAPDNIKFQNTFQDLYRRFVDKSVRLIDILTSISQTEVIVRTLNQLYPNQAQQFIPDLNYRYVDITQIEYDPIRQSVRGMNQTIASIKQDVDYIRRLNQREITRIYPNTIWLFQKLPTLTAAVSEL